MDHGKDAAREVDRGDRPLVGIGASPRSPWRAVTVAELTGR
ncbi:hypothetical protein [Streptomyces sp. NPDC047706]